MKFFTSSLLISLLVISSSWSYAQESQEWCGTDQMHQKWLDADPVNLEKYLEMEEKLSRQIQAKGGQNTKAPLIIVPVVVHVIHSNGIGNISKAQIEDGIRALNEDFSRSNADSTNVRSRFKSLMANAEIEFRLARKDPNGNCTEGINRINSTLTFNAGNNVKALSYWDADNYMNFWVVQSIGSSSAGTTLGFAQFPGGPKSTYGAVVINSAWGAMGTSGNDDTGVITHEVGHLLNLLHPFQSGCGFSCHNSGDRVCDTPPASAPSFNCDTTLNSCSNDNRGGTTANPNPFTGDPPNMAENFMSYDNCRSMITKGQKDRMRSSINFFTVLTDLTKSSNLTATGTNNGFVPQTCAPIADIHFFKKFICQGASMTISGNSYNGEVTTYEWSFPGGTPSTSSDSAPSIVYNNPGTYNIKMKVSNSGGSDSLTITDAVVVGDTSAAPRGFNYSEGFETSGVIGGDWTAVSPTKNAKWTRVGIASFSGNSSAFLDNNNNSSQGEDDYLVSPPIDLTQVLNPTFEFRLAYRQKSATDSDVLRCAISIDCGETWTNRLFLSSSFMSNGTAINSYVPQNQSDWKKFTVTPTGAMKNNNHVLFRFDFTAGGGNNIYIDDFNVVGQPVGIEEEESLLHSSFSVFPNPSTRGTATIQFISEEKLQNASIYLTDIMGKRIKEIYQGSIANTEYQFELNTSALSSGIYFLSLQSENGRITKKLVVK